MSQHDHHASVNHLTLIFPPLLSTPHADLSAVHILVYEYEIETKINGKTYLSKINILTGGNDLIYSKLRQV